MELNPIVHPELCVFQNSRIQTRTNTSESNSNRKQGKASNEQKKHNCSQNHVNDGKVLPAQPMKTIEAFGWRTQ
jgi:hypothetical protein